ncbi:ras-related and estrogen-regulated growth inhibitor [Uranotaenia lowii]|uniref:ras-related and estrogen-regulated growth inhibitor n=1 Tax=Uranotaenia lowii TaxID=190385 RepID=UPI00247A6702|nr:ras-related and estrogen-regulated growth inhibitor [Uranotaenia lowii]XP_055596356.1 ras-related and estrogen-regulated growth inhibitor [Uranotaenia lowii]XP_055596357.1 ras-related and estrogen-regulated growth inhibitor [Uranotaenia lowii]XP_055596358.1 ras-related and estrogen-regulated growth inhibitor [Uranotaenia lowii]
MNTTSPKSSLVKLGLHSKSKSFRVMVLGQSGVGKTAMVVRFITKRFIGEYDPNLEKVYTFHTLVDNEFVQFEILDAAGQPNETDCVTLEANIRWADAFILMYSVTDKCSFDECNRLKFLINFNKRRRRLGSYSKDTLLDVPVILVGNKIDQMHDRMVLQDEGQRRSREIACACFHEISVRESIDQVVGVFRDACRFWRVLNRYPKLKRSTSDVHDLHSEVEMIVSPDCIHPLCNCDLSHDKRRSIVLLGRPWTEEDPNETDESESSCCSSQKSDVEEPFRGRASTDGTLLSRPRRWRYAPPGSLMPHATRVERRMSISMRGSNASY